MLKKNLEPTAEIVGTEEEEEDVEVAATAALITPAKRPALASILENIVIKGSANECGVVITISSCRVSASNSLGLGGKATRPFEMER